MPTIKKFQNPVDFVTQFTGSVDGLFDMALLNGISVTDEPIAGTELKVGEVKDRKVIRVFGPFIDITSYLPNIFIRRGGIGYMQIGNDFKVS